MKILYHRQNSTAKQSIALIKIDSNPSELLPFVYRFQLLTLPVVFATNFPLDFSSFFRSHQTLTSGFTLTSNRKLSDLLLYSEPFIWHAKVPPQAFALRAMRNGSYISYYYNFYCYFSIFPQLVFSFFLFSPLLNCNDFPSTLGQAAMKTRQLSRFFFLLSLASLCCQKIKILQFPWEAKFYFFSIPRENLFFHSFPLCHTLEGRVVGHGKRMLSFFVLLRDGWVD